MHANKQKLQIYTCILALSFANLRKCFASCCYLCFGLICIFVLSLSIRSPDACYRQWFHRVRHFSVSVRPALLALGTSVRGPQLYYLNVCMCVFVHTCVFSALIYQHACPLIMKVMIHQQMTYSRKKTQHNLLFTATLSSVIFDSF